MNKFTIAPTWNISTIEEILTDENLKFVRTDQCITTGFINQSITIQKMEHMVYMGSAWRATLALDEAVQLLAVCNEWNKTTLLPCVSFHEESDNLLHVTTQRSFDTSAGVSFNQLGAFTVSTIDSFVGVWNHFDSQFPHRVTWENQ